VSAVRWGIAGNIFAAWVLTLPAAATVGALTYGLVALFGDGAAGPVIVGGALFTGLAWLGVRRTLAGRTLTAER
jgi:PiT family inorganic phosphate transporter